MTIRTVVRLRDVPGDTRRGGELRVALSPKAGGTTAGFMGVGALEPGDYIAEHWHPYSEEWILVTAGALTVRLDGEAHVVGTDEGVSIPIGVRHRLENHGEVPASFVFALAPLAPEPRLGHVDTEEHRAVVGVAGGCC